MPGATRPSKRYLEGLCEKIPQDVVVSLKIVFSGLACMTSPFGAAQTQVLGCICARSEALPADPFSDVLRLPPPHAGVRRESDADPAGTEGFRVWGLYSSVPLLFSSLVTVFVTLPALHFRYTPGDFTRRDDHRSFQKWPNRPALLGAGHLEPGQTFEVLIDDEAPFCHRVFPAFDQFS